MPKTTRPLTEVEVRNAKPRDKRYKLADGGGLYLEVLPGGGKSWRMKYHFGGKEKRLVFGLWPEVSLKDARDHRTDARKLLVNGQDPSAVKKAAAAISTQDAETFELVAREWQDKFKPKWSPAYADKLLRRLEKDVFPFIGAKPIRDISPPELLALLRRVEARGAPDIARRLLWGCGQIQRYAVATGRAERDVSADLRGALSPIKVKHHASLTDPKDIGALLRAIDEYGGNPQTIYALKLASHLFLRPGELRGLEWSEINFDAAEIRIQAHRMKMREQHIVPLSRQVVALLREIHQLTGGGRFVFPSELTPSRCMSENTVNTALRRLGYTKEEMTGHGFRSLASTRLHEMGYNSDVIERQLSHCERNGVKASYNFAQHLPERRKLMQQWSDYLDGLKTGAKVIPIHGGKAAIE